MHGLLPLAAALCRLDLGASPSIFLEIVNRFIELNQRAEPSSPVLRTIFGRATLPAVQRLKQQDRPVSAVAAGG